MCIRDRYQGAYLYADSSALNEVCHAVYMVAVTVGYQDIVQLPHSTGFEEWLYPVLPYLCLLYTSLPGMMIHLALRLLIRQFFLMPCIPVTLIERSSLFDDQTVG